MLGERKVNVNPDLGVEYVKDIDDRCKNQGLVN